MIVSNSSPIIILGKQGMLWLLEKSFNKVIIPDSVRNEVVLKKDSPEAIALEEAINKGWLIVEQITINPLLHTQNLGLGEKEAISLAAKHKCLLLIDDETAKKYASILSVETHGTFYVVYLSCKKNFISKEEAKKTLNRMIADNLYISIEVYSKFIELLNSLK